MLHHAYMMSPVLIASYAHPSVAHYQINALPPQDWKFIQETYCVLFPFLITLQYRLNKHSAEPGVYWEEKV